MTACVKKFLRSGIGLLARKASRNYIAGPELEDAQRISNVLSGRGYWITQGYWDSADDTPAQVLEVYQAAIERLGQFRGNNYLSIKIPALEYNAEMYSAVLSQSRQNGIPVHFDSLAPEHASRIFSFIRQYTESPLHDVGCTLPGRWLRSVDDAELVNELGLNVRVVKGQWKDPGAPELDPRSGYLQVIDRLAGNSRCVRVATHDLYLAKAALSRLKAARTSCEMELIYGLPMKQLVSLAAEMDVPVRVYVAFGHAYLPYALSGLRKNPRMILPFIKEAFKGNYLSSIPVCSSNGMD